MTNGEYIIGEIEKAMKGESSSPLLGKIICDIQQNNRCLCFDRCSDCYCDYLTREHQEQCFSCLDCEHHFFSDMYIECELHNRINSTEICNDFKKKGV